MTTSLPQLTDEFKRKFRNYEDYGVFVEEYEELKSEFDATEKPFQVTFIVTDIDDAISEIGIPNALQDKTINDLRIEVGKAARKRKAELREKPKSAPTLSASAPPPDDFENYVEAWERNASSPVIYPSPPVIDPSVDDNSHVGRGFAKGSWARGGSRKTKKSIRRIIKKKSTKRRRSSRRVYKKKTVR